MKCEPTASDALHGPHLRHPKLFLRRRNPTIMNKKFIHIALALSCALVCQAAEPGKSQKLGSPDQVPEGLEKSDWQGISQAYQASQFRSAKNAGLTTQQAYLKASNDEEVNGFGGSVAVSGDTVVVSAYVEDSPTTGVNRVPDQAAFNSGTASFSIAAYVFVRSGGTWSQQACLKTSDSEGGVLGGFGGSGSSVAISGDTVVVGATEVAYVFVRTGDSWSQQADLKVSNPGEFDGFGASVAVSGNTVVVGAHLEASSIRGVNSVPNEAADGSGAAYVFVRSGDSWSQQAYLKASNTEANDFFGGSVAVSGDTVVVGASSEASSTNGVNSVPNEKASGSGAAYVFVRSGGKWSQQAYLKASNPGAIDFFGTSVAISGNMVVVGAPLEASSTRGVNSVPNEEGFVAGAAYVFVRSGGTWRQQAYLKASNTGEFDGFGASVAVSGDTVVIGAYGESSSTKGLNGNQANNRARNSGAAYVFTRSGGNWSQRAYLKASNTGPSDEFGGFVAISGSTIISGATGEDSSTSGINTVPNDTGTANDSGAAYIFALPTQFQVNVKTDMKLGRVTGAGCFSEGRNVTLKATPKEGREFVGWFEKKKLVSKNKKLVIKNLTTNRVLEAKFK